jgi:esterase/lipase superfamily enzyme
VRLGTDHAEYKRALANLAVLHDDMATQIEASVAGFIPAIFAKRGTAISTAIRENAETRGRLEQALRYRQRAFEIRIAAGTFLVDSIDLAASLGPLGWLNAYLGHNAEAGQLLLQALMIRDQHLLENDDDLRASLEQLAVIFGENSEYARRAAWQQSETPTDKACGTLLVGEACVPSAEQLGGERALIFFGTDRDRTEAAPQFISADTFGGKCTDTSQLGYALVTAPDPTRASIAGIRLVDDEELPRMVRYQARVRKSTTFEGHALILVHGFATTFDDALKGAGQLVRHLNFDGSVFIYSWPSQGVMNPDAYKSDEGRIRCSTSHFRQFLRVVFEKSNIRMVHVIAHSMGNRLLLNTLNAFRDESSGWADYQIGNFILAAADVGKHDFESIAARITNVGAGITSYASGSDLALFGSQLLHHEQRVGEVTASGPIVVQGVDTIDVTGVDTRVLSSHSAYATSPILGDDIKTILLTGGSPAERNPRHFRAVRSTGGTYWKYEK